MLSKTHHLLLFSERPELLERAYSTTSTVQFSLTIASDLDQFKNLSHRFDFQGFILDMESAGIHVWEIIKEIKTRHPMAFSVLLLNETQEDGLNKLISGTGGWHAMYPPYTDSHLPILLDDLKSHPIFFHRCTGADPDSAFSDVQKLFKKITTLDSLDNIEDHMTGKPESLLLIHVAGMDALLASHLNHLFSKVPQARVLLICDNPLEETVRSAVKKHAWAPLPYPHGIVFLLENLKEKEKKPDPDKKPIERVLVVDDEPALLDMLVDTLSEEGYEVDGSLSGEEARKQIKEKEYHVALVDFNLGDATGLALSKEFRQADEDINCILMTAHASLDMAVKAIQADIYDYIIKPINMTYMKRSITKALEKRRLALEIKALVADLTKANNQLNELSEIKSKFLSIVSHDLRTPLTSIKGYAQVMSMQKDIPPDTRSHYLNVIAKEADHLGNLINDLMDFVSIEAGKLRVEKTSSDLNALIEGVHARMMPIAEQKNIRLETQIKDKPLPKIDMDAHRIDQVLTNLVGNAFKHTPTDGKVLVQAEIRGHFIHVQVSDSGEGIPPEDLSRIFGQFYQVESHQSKKQGIGLGLTISKEIIQAHGGEIGADSEGKGKGSQFWFTLPI